MRRLQKTQFRMVVTGGSALVRHSQHVASAWETNDATAQQLFFSPLVITACAREAAHTVNREQCPQMIALAESLSVLEKRLIIERFTPESPIPDSRAIAYRLAESTPRKATRAGDDRVAAEEWHMSFRIQWNEAIATYHDAWALFDYIGNREVDRDRERAAIGIWPVCCSYLQH